MRILVTGITGRMCGNERLKDPSKLMYGRMQAIMYADELDAMGHEVYQAKPEWGHDFEQYDKIFVGIAPLSSLSAANFIEVGHILRMCDREQIILYVEDWSVENLTKDWIGKLADEAWRKHLTWRGHSDPDQACFDEVRMGLMEVVKGLKCPYPVVASMFPWGDHGALMGPSYDVVAWDVSPLIQKPELQPPGELFNRCNEKERTWVLGALSDQSRWVEKQNFQWPVLQYGHKSSGQPRLQEADLIKVYNDSWGVLCPPYKKSGTGWWRNRYNWSAYVGSILLCDYDDACVMGEPFILTPADIEGMDDKGLATIAQEQREWHGAHIWNREQLRDAIGDLLRRSGPQG